MSQIPEDHLSEDEEGAIYASPIADLVAAGLLIVLSVWYTTTALGFRTPGGWHTGPGLVPAAAGISMILMAVALGISAWRRPGWTRPNAPADDESIADPGRTAILAGIIFGYLLALQSLSMPVEGEIFGRYLVMGSFEVATILCLCVLMKIFWGGPLWIIAAVSTGWTLFLGLVFRTVFYISLPA